jgi:LEA14-like dessication related protein
MEMNFTGVIMRNGNKMIILVVLILLSGNLWSDNFKLLTPEVLDLGEIPEDKISEGIIRFKNDGDTPMRIERVRASCGCTVVDLDKLEYGPGEEGKIKVQLNTKGFSGTTRKSINIYMTEGTPSNIRVMIQAYIKPKLAIDPRYIDMQNVKISEGVVKKTIEITNNLEDQMVINIDVNNIKNLNISPLKFELKPGETDQLKIEFKPEMAGQYDGYIKLVVTEPFNTIKPIGVYINVTQ